MHFTEKKVRDLMVPIDEYAVIDEDRSLKDAVLMLEEGFLKKDPSGRHRTILVVDKSGKLVGILDFRRIIEVLIPECSEKLREKLEELGLALQAIHQVGEDKGAKGSRFYDRVAKNAQTRVGDIMLRLRGSTQADTDLLDAIKVKCGNRLTVLPVYDGNQLVGVLRDVDVFLAVAQSLRD